MVPRGWCRVIPKQLPMVPMVPDGAANGAQFLNANGAQMVPREGALLRGPSRLGTIGTIAAGDHRQDDPVSPDPAGLDAMGVAVRPGDRVWLVALAADGLRRLAAGVVLRLEADLVWWLDDGCRVHASAGDALKVVARAAEVSR